MYLALSYSDHMEFDAANKHFVLSKEEVALFLEPDAVRLINPAIGVLFWPLSTADTLLDFIMEARDRAVQMDLSVAVPPSERATLIAKKQRAIDVAMRAYDVALPIVGGVMTDEVERFCQDQATE